MQVTTVSVKQEQCKTGKTKGKGIGKNTSDDVESSRLVGGITPQTPISSGLKGNCRCRPMFIKAKSIIFSEGGR